MQQWFIDTNEEVAGPLTHSELCQWIQENRLGPDHRVSFDRSTWIPATAVRELVAGIDPHTTAALARTVKVEVPAFPGYLVTGVIGMGACGVVYKAKQLKLDRFVALKAVSFDKASFAQWSSQFDKEAAVLARLQHPNIVQVFDFDRDATGVFFAMELLDGENLKARIERSGRLDERTAWVIARQTAGALGHAARLGIFHRDVKPSNLFLIPSPSGFGLPQDLPLVKVTDFGLALTRQPSPAAASDHPAVVVGTPLYMAPEQATNPEVDHRADIFALGATIFHALAGRPPFEGATIWDILSQKAHHTPRLAPPVPADSADLVAAMMAIDPNQRIGSYEELIARIDRLPVMQGLGGLPGVQGPAKPSIRPRRCSKLTVAAGLIGVLLTVGFALSPWRRPAPLAEASGSPGSFVTTGTSEQLFDGKTLVLWSPIGGQPWSIERDDDQALVLTGKGGVRRRFRPYLPDFRVTLGVDLFQARSCDIAIENPGAEPGSGFLLRVSRDVGALAGRWVGNREQFEPISDRVPFPSAEEQEGKVPYLEVRFERAGGQQSVFFHGRKVTSLADRGAWKEAILRIVAEQGPVRIDSGLQEELRPSEGPTASR